MDFFTNHHAANDINFNEAVSKVIDTVILNLFQDPNIFDIRSRNKFGMTRLAAILTFETVSSD
jgi:hypothetical protein